MPKRKRKNNANKDSRPKKKRKKSHVWGFDEHLVSARLERYKSSLDETHEFHDRAEALRQYRFSRELVLDLIDGYKNIPKAVFDVSGSLVSQRAQRKSRDLFFNSEMEKRVQKRKVLKSQRLNASMDAGHQPGSRSHKNATLL